MPFLLLLQEANAAAGDPDPALPSSHREPKTRKTLTTRPRSYAGDAVQMTPELWQRNTYIHRLNEEFSLDLSQPMALKIVGPASPDDSPAHLQGLHDAVEPMVGADDFDDDHESLVMTDQLPFLQTKLLPGSENDDSAFASLDDDDDDAEAATPPRGDAEILLDSFALDALRVDSRTSVPPSFDDGDIEPPSVQQVAAEAALRILEGDDDDSALDAEFYRHMASHFSRGFEDDLGQELRRALAQKEPPSAYRSAVLEAVARKAVQNFAKPTIDAFAEFDEHSPFRDEEWQFAETIDAGRSARVRSLHDLSTEVLGPPLPQRERAVPRSRRRPRQGISPLHRAEPQESTGAKSVAGLPWESLRSAGLFDSGWEQCSQEDAASQESDTSDLVSVAAAQAFEDETVPISNPDQRAAHRRARELFLGAVAQYRAGKLSAALTDALLACVFDPENPTYRVMANRWQDEIRDGGPDPARPGA